MEKTAVRLRQKESDFAAIYANRSGQDAEQVRAWMDEEKWMSAAEAIELGFADELVTASVPAVACVSDAMMNAMRGMYTHVPIEIATEIPDYGQEGEASMELTNLTLEALREGNPTLYASIVQTGESAERQRYQEIDDLTPAGYEALAAERRTQDLHQERSAASLRLHRQQRGEEPPDELPDHRTVQRGRMARGACTIMKEKRTAHEKICGDTQHFAGRGFGHTGRDHQLPDDTGATEAFVIQGSDSGHGR